MCNLCRVSVAIAAQLLLLAPSTWAEPWPAEPIGSAVNLTAIEGSGTNDFHHDLSGAFWNPVTRRLWVCRNGPGGAASKFWAIVEDGPDAFAIDYRDDNRGEWTGFGDLEGITQADFNEDVIYVIIEGEERIKEYDVSVYGAAILNQVWDTRAFLPLSGGSGAEGITFVPDAHLLAAGFVDGDGVPYLSQHGMGGLMFVAHQNGGRIYVFDLDRGDGSFTFVGAYRTNYSESCSLEFDRSSGLLYIFHGAGRNTIEVADLSSVAVGSERQFTELYTYDAVAGGNLEGIAVQPNDDCAGGRRGLFLTIDDGGANSLFWFRQFPCDAECLDDADCDDADPCTFDVCAANSCAFTPDESDDDNDGVVNCIDQCPDAPDVDADSDGTLDCDDGCPEDPAKISPGACGCGVAEGTCGGGGGGGPGGGGTVPACRSDAACDDGLYCNGSEACVAGVCALGIPPCSGAYCDEQVGRCGECLMDEECDQGKPCLIDACIDGLCVATPDTADDDFDGVPNCRDQCPDDDDVDSDQDGVLDCRDRCPADPDKITPGICGCGIPDVLCDLTSSPDSEVLLDATEANEPVAVDDEQVNASETSAPSSVCGVGAGLAMIGTMFGLTYMGRRRR